MASPSANPQKVPSLAVLVAITTINPLALNILQPALPEMTRALATDYGTIQLTLALFLVGSALAQIGLGPITDKYGRRPVALWGTAIFVLGSVGCMFANSIALLVLGRIVQAIGGVAGFVVSRAVIRDLYGRDVAASKLGYVTMAMVIVPMLSPLVGGWIIRYFDYTAVFAFTALAGLVALIFAVVDLSETKHRAESGMSASFTSAYAILLSSRAFIAHSLTMGLTSATFFTFLAGTPYVVIELQKVSPAAFGIWWVCASISFMFGNFLAGRLGERLGSNMLVRIGTALPLLGLALLAGTYAVWPGEPAVLFLATIPGWIGSGMSLPGASANALSVRPDLAGAASGLSGAVHLGAGALAAFVVGHLLADSAWPMIAIMTITAILALIASLSAGSASTWRG
ncbi:MAG: multidrug effflux MFS transporter [Bradyrhizobiaceae bacterium]|nr:multidrug effflux MFS transporter [Bradyrhizobiaceae bacterium]